MDSLQKANSTVVNDGTDPDFIWQEYLDETKSVAAPPTAFTHVEYSLESGFKVGMKLEVPNPDDATTYWVATVKMTCGDLLTLRYAGYGDDRSADFWFNIKSGEFHPVGWCSANNKQLCPPKGLAEKFPNTNFLLSDELKTTESIPAALSEDLDAGFIPIDQIKCGMKLELVEEYNPLNVWIVTINQNVGGRLMLRYDGSEETADQDVWLFYLSERLHPIGYAELSGLQYCPPEALKAQITDERCKSILEDSLSEAKKMPFPAHVFEPRVPPEAHAFEEGMKLEAVNLHNYLDLCPATVTKVLNDHYFVVTIDSHAMEDELPQILCCHSNTPYIFPVRWAEENGLELKIPKGYEVKDSKFSWDDYLDFCKGNAAPPENFSMCFMNMGFDVGMKLEAVDPVCLKNINAATITNIVEPLMWLQFDSEESHRPSVISNVNSYDIYPVGWCDSNSYPLRTPLMFQPKSKLNLVLETVDDSSEKSSQESQVLPSSPTGPPQQSCKSWCPKIYFNHRCFTGPLLSKSRLAELPQAIGPGPIHLVIKEVIYRVVNIAYKSSQVLQLLQIEGKPTPGMQQHVIKAKYKGKTNRATIEVTRNSEQIEEFCKSICDKLHCCSHLFGPKHVGETCPSNCHTQTKTKFGYNFVKKHKKPGRPPLQPTVASSDNGEAVKRGPGRKKKRKHWTHLLAAAKAEEKEQEKASTSRNSSETDDTAKGDPSEKVSFRSHRMSLLGKKKLKHLPRSSIVTRGAKLPNFRLWHHVTSFHNRRGRPRTRPLPPYPPRKVGRPLGSTKKNIVQMKIEKALEKLKSENEEVVKVKSENIPTYSKPVLLDSNPLEWSVEDVVQYLKKTKYACLGPLLRAHEIDGQALLMLNISNVQEYLHLQPVPAEHFCYFIRDLKLEFFSHYVS